MAGLRSTSSRVQTRVARRAFTLIDLLTTIAVITVLIGILLPSLGTLRETARRTVCRSNIRQIGFGIASYADERKGLIPSSIFKADSSSRRESELQEMMTLRLDTMDMQGRGVVSAWDGLGLLHEGEYLRGPKVYYCPSHTGLHPFSRYAPVWGDRNSQEIVCNYQYRGSGPDGSRYLFRMEPLKAALVSDGMRSARDFSHVVGANILRADLSAEWYPDPSRFVSGILKNGVDDASPAESRDVDQAWRHLDISRPN